jgi:hypothetical protein
MTLTIDAPAVRSLRRLHLVRGAVAIAWAALFAVVSPHLGVATLALAVAYPVLDVVASYVAARAGGPSSRVLWVGTATSAVAAVALAVVALDDRKATLLVWGVWAIVSGALQLGEGLLRRRELGGQWPALLSGGLSVLAGAGFVASAPGATSLAGPAGYAVLGGVFFLVSALRSGRSA